MDDDKTLGPVLKALDAVFGKTPFSAGQVRKHNDAALQAALASAVGLRRGGTVLGWLKRHVATSARGLRLGRVGCGFSGGIKAFYVEIDHDN